VVLPARAQDIEPRAYSNAPIGVNFLIAGYGYTRGGLSFDSACRSPMRISYIERCLRVRNRARSVGKIGEVRRDRAVHLAFRHGEIPRGPGGADRQWLRKTCVRLSINLYGAPALTLKEFTAWQQDLIIGASLQVSPALGQYDSTRIVNIGTNRWSFKPEVGISKAWVRGRSKCSGGDVLHRQRRFLHGNDARAETALLAAGHVIYGFQSGIWVSVDGTYFAGGRTTIDGTLNSDLQQNWRVGRLWRYRGSGRTSIKFYASSGVSARTATITI
jgi:hypothetical protein